MTGIRHTPSHHLLPPHRAIYGLQAALAHNDAHISR